MNNYFPNNILSQNNKIHIDSIIKLIREGIDLLGKNINDSLFNAYNNYVISTLNIISINTGKNYLNQYLSFITQPNITFIWQNNIEKIRIILMFLLDIISDLSK